MNINCHLFIDFREKFFAIADALIGGRPIPISSGGGGDISDLRWDGRNPDEYEQSYRRRCMMAAAGKDDKVVQNAIKRMFIIKKTMFLNGF